MNVFFLPYIITQTKSWYGVYFNLQDPIIIMNLFYVFSFIVETAQNSAFDLESRLIKPQVFELKNIFLPT